MHYTSDMRLNNNYIVGLYFYLATCGKLLVKDNLAHIRVLLS